MVKEERIELNEKEINKFEFEGIIPGQGSLDE